MLIPHWPAPALLMFLLLPAQDTARIRAESAPARPQKFFLDAGRHSVSDLITRSGEFLGRTYLINGQENPTFEGPGIDIPRRLELDANGCEEVVSQLMYSLNYAMVTLDAGRGIHEWIFLPGARRGEIKKRATFVPWEEVSSRPNLKTYVVTSFPLKHIDASRATNTIRPMIQGDQTGMDSIAPVGNSVILMGFRDSVATVIKMLTLADVPSPKLEQGIEERIQRLETRLAPSDDGAKKK